MAFRRLQLKEWAITTAANESIHLRVRQLDPLTVEFFAARPIGHMEFKENPELNGKLSEKSFLEIIEKRMNERLSEYANLVELFEDVLNDPDLREYIPYLRSGERQ